ncbi:MAG: DUF4407 domain-containing protein [Chitinophagales bacterium]|nr:DUF4407 domain-containing protein [Chitinophagales bacterium]
MKREYYVTPKPSPIMKFFWTAAGADHFILERATYSDQIKYMCLGGIVVATGVMAAIAGGYAFYTIFEPRGSAIESEFHLGVALASMLFGCVWGLMIFNIDRFIVTSTGKGDGTEAITWEEFKGAIPRIVMGAIIALTISKPVEIRMFKTEIDAKLYEEQLELQKEYEKRTTANFEERLKVVEGDLGKILSDRQNLIERIKVAEQAYTDNLMGKANGIGAGNGPLSKALKGQLDALNAELTRFDNINAAKLNEAEKKRKEILSEKEVALSKNAQVASGLDGLLERIKLAHHIAGLWISLFITLLFMTIELTPIFFKLMLVKTPYDYMEENIKELMKADEGIYIQYNYYKDKQGLERDLVTHMKVEKLIHEKVALLEKQKELTKYAVGKYGEKLKKQIDDNPDGFIQVEPITPSPNDN